MVTAQDHTSLDVAKLPVAMDSIAIHLTGLFSLSPRQW